MAKKQCWMRTLRASLFACGLGLCGAWAPAQNVTPFSVATTTEPPAPWRMVSLFKGRKPLTRFDIAELDGRRVLRVEADRSYGTLVHAFQPPAPTAPGMRLRWRWRLDQPLLMADLKRKTTEDSPLKVCAFFEVPMAQLGFMERQVLRAGRSMSGEDLPSATLCYVWDHALPVGTVLHSPFTSRLRMIVLESGEQRLGQWLAQERNIHADFLRAFGDESPQVPPLEGLLIGADADNTSGHSLGYVGDLSLGLSGATASPGLPTP